MFFFLKFPETVRAEEEDQVGLQVPEDPHDSSTDTCPTFPFSSDSPRPFPPSPVHTVTDSPIRVSPLTIITNNPSGDDSPIPILSPIHRSSGHNSPTPTSSTPPVLTFSQTFTSPPSIQTTNPSNNPFYSPYFSSSFLHSGPIVFPGSPPGFPYFGIPLPGTSSTFSETVPLPYCPISSRIAPTAKPIPFFSIESQSMASSGPRRRCGRGSRGTHSGRGRAPRGRGGRATSTTSSQTSPILSYLWPNHQPSLVPSKGPFADEALNLVTRPRDLNYFSDSLPPSPFHYDYFTTLKAASPVVIFHCPSPFTLKNFSSVYSINFPPGHNTKSLLVAGINQ